MGSGDQQSKAALIAAAAYGPNTEVVLSWMDDLQTLQPEVWRHILSRARDSSSAFGVAARVVEQSDELRSGMLSIAFESGRAVANASVSPPEAAALLVASRNAGLALLTQNQVPDEATLELYKPFEVAVPRDPLRPRMRRLLRASDEFTTILVSGIVEEPQYLVLTEFFAVGLAYMHEAGKTANGREWAEVVLSGCMGVSAGVAALWLNQPAGFETWFHDAVMLGLKVYVLGRILDPRAVERDFTDRVQMVTNGKVRKASRALPKFRESLMSYGLLNL